MTDTTRRVEVSVRQTAGQKRASQRELAEAAVEACRRLLGVEAVPETLKKTPPDNYKRRQLSSIRLIAGAATVIASRRRSVQLAGRETAALTAMGLCRAPAPRLLAAEGLWLIQEDVGRTRLSQKLQGMNRSDGLALLAAAADGLWRCQEAGAKAGLAAQGVELTGYDKLMAAPAKLAEILKIPAPEFAQQKIRPLIAAPESVFIKWDARPANAIVSDAGAVLWIDWEEWGRRCRLDDLVWLVCDEWVPDWGEAEDEWVAREIRAHAAPFAGLREAERYFAAFGTLHLLLRLGVLLITKGAGGWWDEDLAHAHDLIGVTRECALRLISRAARFAAKVEELQPLGEWTTSLPGRLPA
jgi:hypothetical protein